MRIERQNRAHNIIASVSNAWSGIANVYVQEQNFRIQIFASIIVFAAGYFFSLNRWEWIILFLLATMILLLELLNSAVEQMADLMRPRLMHHVKLVKDMTAGAVLIASFGSIIVGILIFLPHIFELLLIQ